MTLDEVPEGTEDEVPARAVNRNIVVAAGKVKNNAEDNSFGCGGGTEHDEDQESDEDDNDDGDDDVDDDDDAADEEHDAGEGIIVGGGGGAAAEAAVGSGAAAVLRRALRGAASGAVLLSLPVADVEMVLTELAGTAASIRMPPCVMQAFHCMFHHLPPLKEAYSEQKPVLKS